MKYAHQGRNRAIGLDCGGLLLVVAKELDLRDLEILGYASYPNNGRFEELLNTHLTNLGVKSEYPHEWTGDEFLPGDIISFDYNNGEGVRHAAFVSRWDGSTYWVIDAIPEYGVTEHPLRHPFSKATIEGYRID